MTRHFIRTDQNSSSIAPRALNDTSLGKAIIVKSAQVKTAQVKTALVRSALVKTVLGASLMLAAVLTPLASAQAAEPKLLGKFKQWNAYVYGSGAGRICYVMSEPTKMAPRNANRGDVFVMLTHRPSQNVRNEISTRAGYIYDSKSRPFVKIGDKKFQMFTGVKDGGEVAHWAWLEATGDEARMVKSMRAGSSMTIKGTSKRGTLTTDTYSLSGVTAALKRIDAACK